MLFHDLSLYMDRSQTLETQRDLLCLSQGTNKIQALGHSRVMECGGIQLGSGSAACDRNPQITMALKRQIFILSPLKEVLR